MQQYIIEEVLLQRLDWIVSTVNEYKNKPTSFLLQDVGDYKKDKEKARKLVHNRLEILNEYYQFEYNRVSIRDQKTRWGSCSSSGNLNFNYKIIYLPKHLQDYLVVHELCHLKEMNHSQRFWDLVAQTVPEYKKHRKELREFGKRIG